MTTAVLGGTGFIGTEVVKRLLARGEPVVALSRGKHPTSLPQEVPHIGVDRSDRAGLAAAFQAHSVEAVIDIFALSLRNTQSVLDAAAETGARYVLVSSTDVYSNYEGLLGKGAPAIRPEPADETAPLRTMRYPYRSNDRRPQGVEDDLFEDYDKIPVEEAALGNPALAATVMRLPMVYGPEDKQHRFRWAIDAVAAGGPIQIDRRAAAWLNSYAFVTDVADALALAAITPKAAGQIYNVAETTIRPQREWLVAVAEVMGQTVEIVEVEPEAKGLLHERAEATDLSYPLTLDSSKIRTDLGYAEPTPAREALLRTVAWEQGRL